jgi:VWFA-related protein
VVTVLRPSLLSATLALAAVSLHGQSAPPVAQSSATEPRTIRVDVVVTDTHGRPILNLRPTDFTIVENGTPQTLDGATFMSKASIVGPLDPAGPAATDGSDPKAEERAAKEPGTRVVAVYLDEFHVSSGPSSDRVRKALTRFIDEQLRPADLVAVLKPMHSLSTIRFTRDRTEIRQAIADFRGSKDDLTPRSAFEEQYIGRAPETVRSARAQIVMSGVRALVARMGELNSGLSGLVVVSEGFATDGVKSRERRLPDLGSLVRAAGRSRVLVYSVNPADQRPLWASAEAAVLLPTGTAGSADSTPSLESAARQTGGTPIVAGSDLSSGFQSMMRDLDGYYVLTYRTSTASDGRFHSIEVTTRRRDAQVRTRSGYWAPLPVDLRATRVPSTPIVPMRAIRRSPFIQSWFGTVMQPDGTRRAIFTWTPAATTPRGTRPTRAELVSLKVSTLAGKVLFEGDIAPVRSVVGSTNRVDSAVFSTPPGRLQFDLTILRADGSRLDTGTDDVDIPEVKPGPPVILQPQLFRASSALEFRALSTDANAAPLPGREFRRTEHLLIRVPTYDPSGAPVRVSAKLMNPLGSMLAELPASESTPGSLSQFDVVLARFAPGEYAFELAAESGSGRSRQLIRFRITG